MATDGFLMVAEHLISTMQPVSSFPIRQAPTASSTCPSIEEIDTLQRNAKHVIEELNTKGISR